MFKFKKYFVPEDNNKIINKIYKKFFYYLSPYKILVSEVVIKKYKVEIIFVTVPHIISVIIHHKKKSDVMVQL